MKVEAGLSLTTRIAATTEMPCSRSYFTEQLLYSVTTLLSQRSIHSCLDDSTHNYSHVDIVVST